MRPQYKFYKEQHARRTKSILASFTCFAKVGISIAMPLCKEIEARLSTVQVADLNTRFGAKNRNLVVHDSKYLQTL